MKQPFRKFFFSTLLLTISLGFSSPIKAVPGMYLTNTSSVSSALGGAYLLFAGKFGGEVNKKEISEQRDLAVDGCAKGSKIFKYTLVINKSGQSYTYRADSNVLTSEMQTKLKSLTAGDSFEFSQIKAYLPNGKEVVDVHAKKFFVV